MSTLTTFHMGAGRQSTTISLLILHGQLPRPDHALFADTGSEPDDVYAHLDRLDQEVLAPAGVPLVVVSRGNLAEDVRDPHVYAKIPAYTLELSPTRRGFLAWDEPSHGRIKRQCTGRYKVEPLERATRELLGAVVQERPCRYCEGTGERVAPWDTAVGVGSCSVCRGSGTRRLVGAAPRGMVADVWIGFDATEAAGRINDSTFPAYMRPTYPLLDLPRPAERIADDKARRRQHRTIGWTIGDCIWYLQRHGWTDVPKSACFMCPFTSNARWRYMRDQRPAIWARAVAYDAAIRTGPGLRGQRFLHEDRVPLDEARIDRQTRTEREAAQVDLIDLLAERDAGGCSPYGCHVNAVVPDEAPQ